MAREGDPHRFDPITWVHDYDHDLKVKAGKDWVPKYPDGICTRPDCWPCRIKRLNRGDEQTWEGLARMAVAARVAGLDLDELDKEALKRCPDPTYLMETYAGSGVAFYA